MRIVHTALFGIAALLCAATAVQSQQQNMAAVDPTPPTADAAPTADAVLPSTPAPAAPVQATPAAATPAAPAATPAPAAAKEPAPPAKPPQKSAALEPKKKVYRPALIPADPENVDSDGIAATVNDISVSEFEVRQRMSLFLATAGIQQPNEEERKRIRGQILEQLENEKLQLQEAIKKHITVAPAEVDNQINHMVTDNHLTIEQLREVLTNAGSSEQALRTQITAQIAWQKTVSQEYEDRINISPADVDAELSRYAEGADKPH